MTIFSFGCRLAKICINGKCRGWIRASRHQPGFRHRMQRGLHLIAKNPVGVRDVLQHRSQPLDQRILRTFIDAFGCVRRGQVDPSDDSLSRARVIRERPPATIRFGFGGRGLHQNGRIDVVQQRS